MKTRTTSCRASGGPTAAKLRHLPATFARLASFSFAGLVLLCAAEAWGQSVAPVNPKFLEWQRRKAAAAKTDQHQTPGRRSIAARDGGLSEEENFGLVPDIMDMDYLADINSGVVRAPVGGFPSSYDLRTQSRLTAVRNQNPYGTCWAHATMASMESGILGREGVVTDFSENNLANLHGWDWGFDDGGNGTIATAYLVRWGGPVTESSDSYPNPGGSRTLDPVRHVQRVVWIPGKSDSLDNDAIKEAVMEHGAIMVLYYHSSSYYKSATSAYYYPGSASVNHAVAIVGWNDNYAASNFASRPPGNGAYLVRNSWGTGWGSNGYFWVSYYDGVFARSTMHSFRNAEPVDNYAKIYQYDPLGMIGSFSLNWGANMFTASEAGKIAAVGFYALVPKTSYAISVYTDCSAGKPTSGTCSLTQSGTIAEPGFVTVPLSGGVSVSSGSRFSIVLNLTTPGYSYPHAIEYAYQGITSGANANSGQSFYSSNGSSWTDLTAWNTTANFCIKAYAASAAAASTLTSLSVSGPVTVKSGETARYSCTARYSDNSEKNVVPEWSLPTGSSYATIGNDGTLRANETTVDRIVGVRATYAENGVTKTADWSVTVTAAPPPAPTGLTATQGSESRAVRLSWSVVSGAENYAVYRGATSSTANAAYLGLAEGTKYSDTTADPGKDYWYFIKARNGSGTGSFSNGASGWRALAAPADIVASDGASEASVAVLWSAVEGAAAYKVWRADDFDAEPQPLTGWISATEWADTTAVPGVVYWYSVSAAVDASGSRPSERGVPDDGFRAVPVVPESLTLIGDDSIPSGGMSSYSAHVRYSDGHQGNSPVSPAWEVSSGSVSRTGIVTAPIVSANTEVTLSASTTVDGVVVPGTKKITVTAVSLSAPTGLHVVSAASAGVSLAWDAVPGASGYTISRTADGASEATFQTSTASYTDATAVPGVLYSYRVAAANAAGTGAQSAAVTARVPLAAPTGVKATNDRTDCVRVTWNATAGASHYRVARAASQNGSKTELGSWTSLLSYDDVPPADNTTYWYFVKPATSASGANAGAWSVPAQGTKKPVRTLQSLSISGPESVPSGGEAVYSCAATYSDSTTETVSPSWSVSPSSAGGIGADGKFAAAVVASDVSASITASFGGVTPATKSVLVVAPTPATAEITSVAAAQRWPFSGLVDIDYTLTTTPAGTKASVSVSATDEDHNVALPATTLSGDGATGPVEAGSHRLTWNLAADHPGFHAASLRVNVSAVPASLAAPTGLAATGSTSGIALTWTASTGATSYEVWRNTSNASGSATKIGTATTTSYSDTSATPGTNYWYWVKAISGSLASDSSDSASGVRTLSAPTNLAGTGSTSGVALTWTAATGATSYEVWRNTSNTSGSATKIALPTTTSYVDTIITPGISYYYWVKAVCPNSTSGFSAVCGPVASPLAAPVVTATAPVNEKRIVLSWDAVQGATQYEILRGTSANLAAATTLATVTGATYSDTSVGYLPTYSYWVMAKNGTLSATSEHVEVEAHSRVDLMPLRSMLRGLDGLNMDGTISDDELNIAFNNPSIGNLDSDSRNISPDELDVLTRIQTLNQDKTLISAVMAGTYLSYAGMTESILDELVAISEKARVLKRASFVPTNVTATQGNASSTPLVTVSWTRPDTVETVLRYEVYRADSSTNGTPELVATVTATSYADTSVTFRQGYWYRVKAVYESKTSYFSAQAKGYWGDWCWADIDTSNGTDFMPLRSLCTGLEARTRDGILSDSELTAAMNNPGKADMDGDPTTISDAEMSFFLRIQALNDDKGRISAVIDGTIWSYPNITLAQMNEILSLSKAIKDLTQY